MATGTARWESEFYLCVHCERPFTDGRIMADDPGYGVCRPCGKAMRRKANGNDKLLRDILEKVDADAGDVDQ